jgi:hypothetical protein
MYVLRESKIMENVFLCLCESINACLYDVLCLYVVFCLYVCVYVFI